MFSEKYWLQLWLFLPKSASTHGRSSNIVTQRNIIRCKVIIGQAIKSDTGGMFTNVGNASVERVSFSRALPFRSMNLPYLLLDIFKILLYNRKTRKLSKESKPKYPIESDPYNRLPCWNRLSDRWLSFYPPL